MKHTLTTFAVMAALIVAAIVVRTLVLTGYGWLNIPTPSAAAFIPAGALLLAFGVGFIVRGRTR